VSVLALALWLLAADAPAASARPATPTQLVERLDAAWKGRDAVAHLALWAPFGDPSAEEREDEWVHERMKAELVELKLQPQRALAGGRLRVAGTVFSCNEPRGRVEQVVLTLADLSGADEAPAWAIVAREVVGQIDGLVHLGLDPQGYRAEGLTLRLPDFELRLEKGTLFSSLPSLGPTALVFVGEATVRFSPGSPTEAEQLRQYGGAPVLEQRVRTAFVRIHPADLHKVLQPVRLDADPDAARRLPAAQRVWDQQVSRAFLLDTTLPRSPWWLIPGLGDALVSFETGRGTLQFTVSGDDPEGLQLADRTRKRQICLYPRDGGEPDYDEDERRAYDILHHDLSVRFDPERFGLVGTDTLRLRLLGPVATIRLRLEDDLRVLSVSSPQVGEHLFFRVRNQDALLVALGPLSGSTGEIELTVRYAGAHRPQPVEHEALQGPQDPNTTIGPVKDGALEEDQVVLDTVLTYTNRTAWYPQGVVDDFATADLRLDVPVQQTAVTGGRLIGRRVEGDRRIVEYRQERPGRYVTVTVGRLQEIGHAQAAAGPVAEDGRAGMVELRAFAGGRSHSRAAAAMASARKVLAFYAERFGPFPFASLEMVVHEARVPGGHSPPGMIVLAERPPLLRKALRDDPASFWDVPDFFLAHELAHQWWGHGVAPKNYRERWMSEAFAQYAATLWVQHEEGDGPFREVLARMASWARRMTDHGPIHLGFRLGHIDDDPQVYRAIVYDKGALVLHMLRGVVGDDAFRAALIALQRDHRFSKAGSEELRAALEQASGRELSTYFEAWVYGTHLPELTTTWRSEPAGAGFKAVVDVKASELPGEVPLLLSISHASGSTARQVRLPSGGGHFEVEIPGRPRRVEVNLDQGLLAIQR
jgi:hypothetical protein